MYGLPYPLFHIAVSFAKKFLRVQNLLAELSTYNNLFDATKQDTVLSNWEYFATSV